MHSQPGDTMAAQRQRILEALTRGPATVEYLRDELHVPQPSTRVCELRKRGARIATITLDGHASCYVMAPE